MEVHIRVAGQSRRPIPANLDNLTNILSSGSPHLPEFQHHGVKLHIILAACKTDDVALESIPTNECAYGQFTAALLCTTLRSLDVGSTTYSELICWLEPLYQYVPSGNEVQTPLSRSNSRSVDKTLSVEARWTDFSSG